MPQQVYEIQDNTGAVFEVSMDHQPTPDEARTALAKYRAVSAPPALVRSRTGQMYDPNAAPTPDVGRFAERAIGALNPMTYVRMAQSAIADPGAAAMGLLRAPIDLAGRVIGGDFSGAAGDLAGGYALGQVPGLVRGGTQAGANVLTTVNPDLVGVVSPRAGNALRVLQNAREAMKAGKSEPVAAPPESATPQSFESPLELTRRLKREHQAKYAATPAETVSGGSPPPANPPASPTPAGSPAKSPQQLLNEEALARRRAEYQQRSAQNPPPQTPDEGLLYQRLRAQGKTDEQARATIALSRAFNAQYGLTTPTVAETKFPKGMRGPTSEPTGNPTTQPGGSKRVSAKRDAAAGTADIADIPTPADVPTQAVPALRPAEAYKIFTKKSDAQVVADLFGGTVTQRSPRSYRVEYPEDAPVSANVAERRPPTPYEIWQAGGPPPPASATDYLAASPNTAPVQRTAFDVAREVLGPERFRRYMEIRPGIGMRKTAAEIEEFKALQNEVNAQVAKASGS